MSNPWWNCAKHCETWGAATLQDQSPGGGDTIHVSPFQGSDFGGCLAPGSASLHPGLRMVPALRACFLMNTIRLLVNAHSSIGWTGWARILGMLAGAYKTVGGRVSAIVHRVHIVHSSVACRQLRRMGLFAGSCAAAGCKPAARLAYACAWGGVCGVMCRCGLQAHSTVGACVCLSFRLRGHVLLRAESPAVWSKNRRLVLQNGPKTDACPPCPLYQ